jgi:hypothetical protein
VIFELESALAYELTAELREVIRSALLDYDQHSARKLEEKDVIIGELKLSLLELTEKRFRQSLLQQQASQETGGSSSPQQLVDLKNIEFMLAEKENQLSLYANELRQREAEVGNLKMTIKEQDDIILSHNSNIYVNVNNFFRLLKGGEGVSCLDQSEIF